MHRAGFLSVLSTCVTKQTITYPKGFLLRRVNNTGDISWHKTRIFISEVFRFEELGFELVTPGFFRVFSVIWRSENSTRKSFDSGLRGE
jgi:hypothetical protein